MKVFLVIDETNFYQPDYVADLIRGAKDFQIIGCALVTKVLPKSDITRYIFKNFYYLYIDEICKLLIKKIKFIVKDRFSAKKTTGRFYSVKAVLDFFQITYFEVHYDINQMKYISRIEATKPDVILSSNSLFFGPKLLSVPRFCINRHSALLPSYGGLWPVLQAVSNGEAKIGVTVHTMSKKIDKGDVLVQEEIIVSKEDTIDSLYQKCFAISSIVTIAALNHIKTVLEGGQWLVVKPVYPESYYTFPTRKTWLDLRIRKRRFI